MLALAEEIEGPSSSLMKDDLMVNSFLTINEHGDITCNTFLVFPFHLFFESNGQEKAV